MDSLDSKKTFCILPWIHMSLGPTGEVHSCCQTDFQNPLGFFKHSSLEEIWNSENFKRFRLEILADKNITACRNCYQQEDKGMESLRQISNREWRDYFHVTDEMNSDGSMNNFDLPYLDLRFSNICNFKCRTCGSDFSTSWYSDNDDIGITNYKPEFINDHKSEELWSELIKLLPKVKKIYFAGGEPLLHKDHFRLLDELIKLNNLDVYLIYNTNLSTLKTPNRDVIDYWKKFKNVTISASMDGIEKKGEYIRKGMTWNNFYENRRIIETKAPHVYFKIFWTLSVFNCFHLIEAMKFVIEKKFLASGNDFEINILNAPSIYNIGILNSKERENLKKEYNFFISDYLENSNFEKKDNFKKNLNYILAHLNSVHMEEERLKFWALTRKLDKLRGEELTKLFPELKSLLHIPFEQ